jgi:hypothetical protein
MAAPQNAPCGWYGSFLDFLLLPKAFWLAALQEHYRRFTNRTPDQEQRSAWDREFDILAKELKQFLQVKPALGNWTIIFGYDVPRWQVRGPDVIILGAAIFVLEFEDQAGALQVHVDQVAASARDLKQYHAGSRQSTIIPLLVPTRAKGLIGRDGDVIILSPDRIADVFTVESEIETGPLIDPAPWIAAGYSPHSFSLPESGE